MTRFALFFALQLVVSFTVLGGARGDEVGTIAAVDGSAEIGRGGTWSAAAPGTAVAVGDQLRTGRPGRMRVVFRDDSVLVLSDDTTLVVDNHVFDPSASESVFGLLQGKLRSVVSHYYGAAGSSYEVRTPAAVAGVRGTEFVMSYDPATGASEIIGINGVITVHSAVDPTGPGLLVTANEVTDVPSGELPTPARPVDPALMRQLMDEMEFFGSSQNLSITDTSSLIAGAMVAQPARAPAAPVGSGAAMVLAPEGPNMGIDASAAIGNSPAAVIAGGTGSINVQPGKRP